MLLLNGDCLELMQDLSDNSIDLLFCDLPYGCTACVWDTPIDLNKFWKQVNRICKITCPMFFTCSTKFGVTLINSNTKNFRYDLVWVKSTPCGFLNAKKMPMRKHEMLYVFYRKLPMYDLSSHNHKFIKETEIQNKYEPPLPNSLLEIKSEKGKHATQKPVELIKWCLKYYSKERDTILDPTMGSGSTGVACKDMNRNFIGMELDKEIFEVARKRLIDNVEENNKHSSHYKIRHKSQ